MTNATTEGRERSGSAERCSPRMDDFAFMRRCCDETATGMPHGCKAMFTRHRWVAYTALALLGLSIVTLHVGAVLGILAFLKL